LAPTTFLPANLNGKHYLLHQEKKISSKYFLKVLIIILVLIHIGLALFYRKISPISSSLMLSEESSRDAGLAFEPRTYFEAGVGRVNDTTQKKD
jgi:hypothetical protein